jgi:hypothetical protein
MRHPRLVIVLATSALIIGLAGPVAAHPSPFNPGSGGLGAAARNVTASGDQGAVLKHFRLIGHSDLGGSVLNADVWAHRGYAYVGVWSGSCPATGVKVVNYRDPRNPQLVSTLPNDTGTSSEDIVVRHVSSPSFTGELAVTGIQRCEDAREPGFRGLAFFDVTYPEAPTALGRWDAPEGSVGCHEVDLVQRPDGMVLAGCSNIFAEQINGTDEVVLVDATNPTAPVTAGGWALGADLGIDPDNVGCDAASFAHSVRFINQGNALYASYWDFGAVKLNITNPAAPAYVDRADVAPPDEDGDVHSVVRGNDARTLLVNPEDFSPAEECTGDFDGWGEVHLFDVGRHAPRHVGTFSTTNSRSQRTDGFYSVHNTEIARDTQAFSSWYSDGIVWWQFTKPPHPKQRGQFVPPAAEDPTGNLPTAPIVWGVFIDHAHNLVLASDMNSGLWIVKPVGLRNF